MPPKPERKRQPGREQLHYQIHIGRDLLAEAGGIARLASAPKRVAQSSFLIEEFSISMASG